MSNQIWWNANYVYGINVYCVIQISRLIISNWNTQHCCWAIRENETINGPYIVNSTKLKRCSSSELQTA